jgi:hypothetical protein
MSYESQSGLVKDKGFQDRVTMCVAEQAQIFVNDDRPEYQQLAYQAIGALEATANQFIPLVARRRSARVAHRRRPVHPPGTAPEPATDRELDPCPSVPCDLMSSTTTTSSGSTRP